MRKDLYLSLQKVSGWYEDYVIEAVDDVRNPSEGQKELVGMWKKAESIPPDLALRILDQIRKQGNCTQAEARFMLESATMFWEQAEKKAKAAAKRAEKAS